MGKRICFVSSRSAYLNGNEMVMDWANGRLISELLNDNRFEWSVAIFADPIMAQNYDYTVNAKKIYSLPFPLSYSAGLFNSLKIYRTLKMIQSENDQLVIQLPIVSFLPLLFLSKPVIYHLCANVTTAAANPFKYKGILLVVATLFARSMNLVFRVLFAKERNQLIVNGNELGTVFKKYNPIVAVSSSIKKDEIMEVPAILSEKTSEFKILFIGRPSKEKGFDILISAFKKLVDSGRSVTLSMIGIEKDQLISSLLGKGIESSYLARISFYGFVSWSEKFKTIVRTSNCLVMCSVSEGTPRVIIEAMALGCPVIATNVGGVSSVINGSNGLLIPPGDSIALEKAVIKLNDDESLRLKLSMQALVTVKQFTLEGFSKTFKNLLIEK